jgi:ribosome-binding protein aMBF1 (putative translation factor)
MRTVEPRTARPGYRLPRLARKRPRIYEEWAALRRWGRLPEEEAGVVGYLLREAREAAGLSQVQLADRLECTQQAVSQAERWVSNPTIEFVRRWAAAVDLDLEIRMARQPGREARSGLL